MDSQNTNQQLTIEDIDMSLLKLGKVKRVVKLFYGDKPVTFTTNKMFIPFGVKIYNSDWSSFTNCHIDCSLFISSNPKSQKVLELTEKLGDRVCDLIYENLGMFNAVDKFESVNEVKEVFNPIFKKNENYPDLTKISLPRDSKGNFDLVIFDKDKQKVPLNDNNITTVLSKGIVFKGIVECSKVWFYNGRFGTMWNLQQMRLYDNKKQQQRGEEEELTENLVKKESVYGKLMIDED